MRVERHQEHRTLAVRRVEIAAARFENELGPRKRRRSESRRAQRGLIVEEPACGQLDQAGRLAVGPGFPR
jgi:hypothetical protein